MNSREADDVARRLAEALLTGNRAEAVALLKPVLEARTPFRYLDRIATAAAVAPWPETYEWLELIADDGYEGGWVIIGSTLHQHYLRQPAQIVARCRHYIVTADTWYGADILGERVPGPALVEDLTLALPLLAPWRTDANRWVRRSVGVAVHFWAKRSRGDEALARQTNHLLEFLEPMFSENELDAVKGVGWGLKTLGRYYPRQLGRWLVAQSSRPHRRLMLRKAVTYLPNDQRQQVFEAFDL